MLRRSTFFFDNLSQPRRCFVKSLLQRYYEIHKQAVRPVLEAASTAQQIQHRQVQPSTPNSNNNISNATHNVIIDFNYLDKALSHINLFVGAYGINGHDELGFHHRSQEFRDEVVVAKRQLCEIIGELLEAFMIIICDPAMFRDNPAFGAGGAARYTIKTVDFSHMQRLSNLYHSLGSGDEDATADLCRNLSKQNKSINNSVQGARQNYNYSGSSYSAIAKPQDHITMGEINNSNGDDNLEDPKTYEQIWSSSPIAKLSRRLFELAINSSSSVASTLAAGMIKVEHLIPDALEQLARHSIAFLNPTSTSSLKSTSGQDKLRGFSPYSPAHSDRTQLTEATLLHHWSRDVVLVKSKFRNPRLQLPIIFEFSFIADQLVAERRAKCDGRLIDVKLFLEEKHWTKDPNEGGRLSEGKDVKPSLSAQAPGADGQLQLQQQQQQHLDDEEDVAAFYRKLQFRSAVEALHFINEDVISLLTFCKNPRVYEELVILARLALDKLDVTMVPVEEVARLGLDLSDDAKEKVYQAANRAVMQKFHAGAKDQNSSNKANSVNYGYQFNWTGCWKNFSEMERVERYRVQREGLEEEREKWITPYSNKRRLVKNDDAFDDRADQGAEKEGTPGESTASPCERVPSNVHGEQQEASSGQQQQQQQQPPANKDTDDQGFWGDEKKLQEKKASLTPLAKKMNAQEPSERAPFQRAVHKRHSSFTERQGVVVNDNASPGNLLHCAAGSAVLPSSLSDHENDDLGDFNRRVRSEKRRFSSAEEDALYEQVKELTFAYHPHLTGKNVLFDEQAPTRTGTLDDTTTPNSLRDGNWVAADGGTDDAHADEETSLILHGLPIKFLPFLSSKVDRKKASYFINHHVDEVFREEVQKERMGFLHTKQRQDQQQQPHSPPPPASRKNDSSNRSRSVSNKRQNSFALTSLWHHVTLIFLAMNQSLYYISHIRDRKYFAPGSGDDDGAGDAEKILTGDETVDAEREHTDSGSTITTTASSTSGSNHYDNNNQSFSPHNAIVHSQSRLRRAELTDSLVTMNQITKSEDSIRQIILDYHTNKDGLATSNPDGIMFIPTTIKDAEIKSRLTTLLANTLIDFSIIFLPFAMDEPHRQRNISTIALTMQRLHIVLEKAAPTSLRIEFLLRNIVLAIIKHRGIQPSVRIFCALLLGDLHSISRDPVTNTTLVQVLIESADQLPRLGYSRRLEHIKRRLGALEAIRMMISSLRFDYAPRALIKQYMDMASEHILVRDEPEFSLWCAELSLMDDLSEDVFARLARKLVDIARDKLFPGFCLEDVASYGRYALLFARNYCCAAFEQAEENRNLQQQPQQQHQQHSRSQPNQHSLLDQAMEDFAQFLQRVVELPEPDEHSFLGVATESCLNSNPNNNNNNKNHNNNNNNNNSNAKHSSSGENSSSASKESPHENSLLFVKVPLSKPAALQICLAIGRANFFDNKKFQSKYASLIDRVWAKIESVLLAFPHQKQMPYFQLRDFCRGTVLGLEVDNFTIPPRILDAISVSASNFFMRRPEDFYDIVLFSETNPAERLRLEKNRDLLHAEAAKRSMKLVVDPFLIDPFVATASIYGTLLEEQRRLQAKTSLQQSNAGSASSGCAEGTGEKALAPITEKLLAINAVIGGATSSSSYNMDFDSAAVVRLGRHSSPLGLQLVLRFINHLVEILFLNLRIQIEKAIRVYFISNLFQAEPFTSVLEQFNSVCFSYLAARLDVERVYYVGPPSIMRLHLHCELALELLRKAVLYGREQRKQQQQQQQKQFPHTPRGLPETLAFVLRFAFALDRHASPLAGTKEDGTFYVFMKDLFEREGEKLFGAPFSTEEERNEERLQLELQHKQQQQSTSASSIDNNTDTTTTTTTNTHTNANSSNSNYNSNYNNNVVSSARARLIAARSLSTQMKSKIDHHYARISEDTKKKLSLHDCALFDYEYRDQDEAFGVNFASQRSIDQWRRGLNLHQALRVIRELVADDCFPQLRRDPCVCDRIPFFVAALENRRFPQHEVDEVAKSLFGPPRLDAVQPRIGIQTNEHKHQTISASGAATLASPVASDLASPEPWSPGRRSRDRTLSHFLKSVGSQQQPQQPAAGGDHGGETDSGESATASSPYYYGMKKPYSRQDALLKKDSGWTQATKQKQQQQQQQTQRHHQRQQQESSSSSKSFSHSSSSSSSAARQQRNSNGSFNNSHHTKKNSKNFSSGNNNGWKSSAQPRRGNGQNYRNNNSDEHIMWETIGNEERKIKKDK